MITYTTPIIPLDLVDYILDWFDHHIGTETEVDKHDNENASITFFEMTSSEAQRTRRKINKIVNNEV